MNSRPCARGKCGVVPRATRGPCAAAASVLACTARAVRVRWLTVSLCRNCNAHTSQEVKDGWNSRLVLVKLVMNERKSRSSSIGMKRPAPVQDAAPPPKPFVFLPTMGAKEPKDMTLPELQQELR